MDVFSISKKYKTADLLILTIMLMLITSIIGCSNKVDSLSIQDNRLPLDSRRYLADAEDAVAIAKTFRDTAWGDLIQAQNLATRLDAELRWDGCGDGKTEFDVVQENHLQLMQLRYQMALAALAHSNQNLVLITAETAMRQDLAVYKLEPIRAKSKQIKDTLDQIRQKVDEQFRKLEELRTKWWGVYSKCAVKGDKSNFWLLAR